MILLITQIHQHIRYRITSLQQIIASSQIISKQRHMLPPRLQTQKRSTYVSSKRCAWRQKVCPWIMSIRMKNQMSHTFRKMIICNVFQKTRMLIPCQFKRSKSFGSNSLFPIPPCSRHRWLNRLKFNTSNKRVRSRLPKLTHGDIGILIIL